MTGIITIDSSLPWWMVASLIVALTILLLWKEWGRKLRFRELRLLAVIVMMLMLAAILLRPQTNILKSNAVLLLTPGYNTRVVDSLITHLGNLTIVQSPGATPYKNSRPLASYHELNTDMEFVTGEGLPVHALDVVDKKKFAYIPSAPPEGIVEVSVEDKPKLNRRCNLNGAFRNRSGAHVITLIGPGGKEDSVAIKNNGVTQFTLSFTPRRTGKILYEITSKDSTGNTKVEKLPIVIEESSPLKVLMMLSYPTFETRFLKNFIASKGNEIVVRSLLSRNNISYEYINHAALKFSAITKNVSDDFDLLIADRQTLQNLSNEESLVLKQSVQNGLGLLALYDVPPTEKDQSNFFPFRTLTTKGDTTTITSGPKRMTLPALPFRVRSEAPLQPVFTNNTGILSGYTLRGEGKIGFQLLQQTYRLILAGDSITYGNVWSPLLERIARKDEQPALLTITSGFPYYADEPITLRLISSIESPTLLADSVKIPLQENVAIDDVWHAKVWPTAPGWHTLQSDGEELEYFVSEQDDWRSLAIENQMKKNMQTSRNGQFTAKRTREQRRINPLFFYSIFLLAAGFLWLAPKL